MSSDRVKIVFRLERDEDGYPPADSESVWARQIAAGEYEIDNIPFFIKGISSGDVVSAQERKGELWFDAVVRHSGHSTVRVLLADAQEMSAFREALKRMGCSSELSHVSRLVAVDIPPAVPFRTIESMLEKGEAEGRWEYEEGAVWAD